MYDHFPAQFKVSFQNRLDCIFSDCWRVRVQRHGLLPPDVTDSDEALSYRLRLSELHGEADRSQVRIRHPHPEGTPQARPHPGLVYEGRIPHSYRKVRPCQKNIIPAQTVQFAGITMDPA